MARDEPDRTGLDESRNVLGSVVGRFVPQWLARRAVAVAVSTDRDRYAPGEPVLLTVEFRNRLPVPIEVETPRHRLWGWTVDGELEASDERRYAGEASGTLSFRPRERKRIRRRWDGRFKRSGEPTRWEPAEPGEYEIEAFVAVDAPNRPADRTTIRIEESR
ncbi:MAG TPA: hypothetical protein VKA37_09730 [Halobacteriales archaeon]|nr:hypothetical protein [Halobacteriales archaeon]